MKPENLSRLPHCYCPAYPIVTVPLTPLYTRKSVPLTPLYIEGLKDIRSFNKRGNAGLTPAYSPLTALPFRNGISILRVSENIKSGRRMADLG